MFNLSRIASRVRASPVSASVATPPEEGASGAPVTGSGGAAGAAGSGGGGGGACCSWRACAASRSVRAMIDFLRVMTLNSHPPCQKSSQWFLTRHMKST